LQMCCRSYWIVKAHISGFFSQGRLQKREFSVNYIKPKEDHSTIPFTDIDIEIIKRHTIACKQKQSTYIDPQTGYSVFTEYYHQERGDCCGNQCRHCPFGHQNVPKEQRYKKFNSVFYQ